MGLVEWVWGLYGRGKLSLAMDVRLNAEELDAKQVEDIDDCWAMVFDVSLPKLDSILRDLSRGHQVS
ncbi:hypothetical protein Syun_004356 [Stephania yunnanensis]|uniref:Uncharacterized protein n=1 Tax=Stephania yunnanensis TaxID=152371 RepID=A0AAP0L713_9MAGN